MGLLEWPHEVNAPYSEDLHLQVVVEGHCVASNDATLQLAFPTPSDEFFGVFIHHWLEESALLDFDLCEEYSIVASVWCCMEFFNDLKTFRCWYTPPQQAVRAYPIHV